jgi:hypothetical protein
VFRGHRCQELGLASNSEIRDSVIPYWLDKVKVKLGDGAITDLLFQYKAGFCFSVRSQ